MSIEEKLVSLFYENKKAILSGSALSTTKMEQVTGIEPALQPWEGRVLPLNHTCIYLHYIKNKPLWLMSPEWSS